MPSRLARRFDEGGPTLVDVGETELLDRLRAIAAGTAAAAPGLVTGPGDDAAVWRPSPGQDLVLSQDCLVEGVDFRREWIRPFQLGRRALNVALSDLAAMGARPVYCLASLCAPGATGLEDVLAIQEGLCTTAAAAACSIAGGDVSDIDGPLVIDVSVGGTVAPGAVLERGAGAAGDALLVTGRLGRAAGGLALLLEPALAPAAGAAAGSWRQAQLEAAARLAEGQALVTAGVRCGGDLSDGLLVEAARTASASGCGAELWVNRLPIDPELPAVFGKNWPALALGGGEDFELLTAVAPQRLAALQAGWGQGLQPLVVVGRLVAGAGVRLFEAEAGEEVELPPIGSRHYR